MKELYILGNGFDIAHGLNTRYLDFRNYLRSYPETNKFLQELEGAYAVYGEAIEDYLDSNNYELSDNYYKYWWQHFEKMLGKGDWFELEFETMASSVINDMVDDEGDPMPDIEDTLKTHWKPYYIFLNDLNSHVAKWINSIDLSELNVKFPRLKNSKQLFINFNYTQVLDNVYEIDESNILYIHGTANKGTVVMGHGNEDVIDKYKKLAKEANNQLLFSTETIYTAIARFYQYTLKDTASIIANNTYFWNKLKSVEKVVVFGHSLGDVDLPYFKTINKYISENAEWIFYVYIDKDMPLESWQKTIKEVAQNISIGNRKYYIEDSINFTA